MGQGHENDDSGSVDISVVDSWLLVARQQLSVVHHATLSFRRVTDATPLAGGPDRALPLITSTADVTASPRTPKYTTDRP